MMLEKIVISHFRSIEDIEIIFPRNTPVVLFGPNNVGKSNVLKALDYFLGERYAPYVDFQDSDFFLRKKKVYPNISFTACFDGEFYSGNRWNPSTNTICFTTNKDYKGKKEHTFHYLNGGEKIFLSNDDREKCQFILIDAGRDIGRQLSYFSQYSILSKVAKRMHTVLQEKVKDRLDQHFSAIKETFESVEEYKSFYDKLQLAFQDNIVGFDHKLDIDLSAYDPNNYFHSLKIIAKEGDSVRSFEEFGTGEQQILLMSFVKAYAEIFKGESFILGIEEPEAHLHPIAQKWLSINISNMTKSGIQIIITTHSPEFLDIECLEGFVKVYKENNTTKVKQHTAETLAKNCISLKSNPAKTSRGTILRFYESNTFYDQLRGFFSRRILLVEGETELFALPNYFKNCEYDLIKNGVEIINCRGKNNITRNYRLFKSFDYDCFCLFDADQSKGKNKEFAETFDFPEEKMILDEREFFIDPDKKYAYFGKNFEKYMGANFEGYAEEELQLNEGKVLNAKILSERKTDFKPDFVHKIAQAMGIGDVPSSNLSVR